MANARSGLQILCCAPRREIKSKTRNAQHACIEEVKWSAYHQLDPDDEGSKAPVGSACDLDYEIGVEKLGYSDFPSFVKAYEKSDVVQQQVAQCKAKLTQSSEGVDFSHYTVSRGVSLEVEVEHNYRGYRESTIRGILDAPRLTRAATERVPCITLPSIGNPALSERWMRFARESAYDEKDKGSNINIRATYTLDKKTQGSQGM